MLAVEMILAKMAPTRRAPRSWSEEEGVGGDGVGGGEWTLMDVAVGSDDDGGGARVRSRGGRCRRGSRGGRRATSPVGKRAEPVTARATMTVSRMTVPMIQPMTAREASFSDLAEKNFWYMDWLPSRSRQVGRKSSRPG